MMDKINLKELSKRPKPNIKVKSTQYTPSLEENINKLCKKSRKLINENLELKTLIMNLIRDLKINKINGDIVFYYESKLEAIQDKYYEN